MYKILISLFVINHFFSPGFYEFKLMGHTIYILHLTNHNTDMYFWTLNLHWYTRASCMFPFFQHSRQKKCLNALDGTEYDCINTDNMPEQASDGMPWTISSRLTAKDTRNKNFIMKLTQTKLPLWSHHLKVNDQQWLIYLHVQ